MDQQDLKELFKSPPQRLGMAPFWFLNEKLDADELRWQVQQMHEKGMSGYVMHARYGLEVPYLSEEWFKKIGVVLEESEKLGMNAIIYDEYDWPSGMSGTRVLDDHPEYAMTYLDISWIRCEDRSRIEEEIEPGEVIAVYGAKYRGLPSEQIDFHFNVGDLIDLSGSVQDGKLCIEDADGVDIVFIFVEKEIDVYHPKTAFPQPEQKDCPFHQPHEWDWYFPYGKYVDLLNPEAVDYFIETTHEEYRRRFEKHFGKTIKMLFTDEPGFYTIMREKYSAVQWSRILPQVFKKKYGYSLIENLPALVADIGDITDRVRHDYWAMVTEMFEINFVKKCADWCEKYNIELIGHFRLCNPFLIWQMNHQGNVIPEMKRMHIPGIDMLDNVEGDLNLRWGTDENVWQVPNKIVSSVAHQYGKPLVMSESFALGGWKYTLRNMKILADWQHYMGINFVVPHAFHYSITGQRKRECPPSQFYQNPMWDNYRIFSDYLRRIELMLINAAHVADIALLFPMESLWSEYPTGTTDRFPWNLSDDFAFITDKLLRWNLDYDVLGQDELELCTIEEGALKIQNENYRFLLIPPMTNIREETAQKIIDFLDNGGKVLFLGLIPWKDPNGKKLTNFVNKLEEVFGITVEDALNRYKLNEASEVCSIDCEYESWNLKCLHTGPLYKIADSNKIPEIISEMIQPDITIKFIDAPDGNIYCSHWRKEKKDIFFLINSEERSFKIELEIGRTGKPFIWDPETGNRSAVSCYRFSKDKNRLIIPKIAASLESCFFVIEDSTDIEPRIIDTDFDIRALIKKDSKTKALLVANGYTNNGFIETLKDGAVKQVKVKQLPQKELVMPDVWSVARNKPNVLVLNRWMQKQGFSEGSGWFNMLGGTVVQEAEFYIQGKIGHLKAIFDRVPEPHTIYINGNKVTEFMHSSYLDHQMFESDITRLAVEGRNTVRIDFVLPERAFQGKTGIDPIELMFDPVLIIGDFRIRESGDDYTLIPEAQKILTGSWTHQGYPFYSGSMDYRQEVFIEDSFIQGTRCYLSVDGVREVMECIVNGKKQGVRMWEPYQVDITDSIKAGANTICLRVWNTLTNLLDLKDFDSGLIGPVKIIAKPEYEVYI